MEKVITLVLLLTMFLATTFAVNHSLLMLGSVKEESDLNILVEYDFQDFSVGHGSFKLSYGSEELGALSNLDPQKKDTIYFIVSNKEATNLIDAKSIAVNVSTKGWLYNGIQDSVGSRANPIIINNLDNKSNIVWKSGKMSENSDYFKFTVSWDDADLELGTYIADLVVYSEAN